MNIINDHTNSELFTANTITAQEQNTGTEINIFATFNTLITGATASKSHSKLGNVGNNDITHRTKFLIILIINSSINVIPPLIKARF
jgi:peroxiredoxin family protein